MPSIRDVAKTAGVSIATVSRVMNGVDSVDDGLRRRVMAAVQSCDYAPSVGRKVTDCLALIYAGPYSIGSPYDSACLEGMVEAIRLSNFDLCIVDVQRDLGPKETLRQFFLRKGIRGAILRCTSSEREVVTAWSREALPLVVLGDHFPGANVPFVFAESATASRQAVEHLISLGHTRIAFAACERDDGDHLDRLISYQQTLAIHGLFDEQIVYRVPPHRLDGAQVLRNMLGTPNRPTAIYIADPLVAVGAINEAHRLGAKLPDDLSILGFDDTDARTAVYPRMSAVCQDSKQLGLLAMQQLLATVEADGTPKAVPPLQAWLEIGNTTGPPPAVLERILPTGTRIPG